MLCLSRKQGESIVIGGSVRVSVEKIYNNRVVLGVNAPLEMPVHRLEIQEQIDNEREVNQLSSQVPKETRQLMLAASRYAAKQVENRQQEKLFAAAMASLSKN